MAASVTVVGVVGVVQHVQDSPFVSDHVGVGDYHYIGVVGCMFYDKFAEVGDTCIGIGDTVYPSWLENIGLAIFVKTCGRPLHHLLNVVGPFRDSVMDKLVEVSLRADGPEALKAGCVIGSYRYHHDINAWAVWQMSTVVGDGGGEGG